MKLETHLTQPFRRFITLEPKLYSSPRIQNILVIEVCGGFFRISGFFFDLVVVDRLPDPSFVATELFPLCLSLLGSRHRISLAVQRPSLT